MAKRSNCAPRCRFIAASLMRLMVWVHRIPPQRANHIPGLFQPKYPFELRTGEIGAFLSHRACWQAILDEGLDAGLILEDDVALDIESFNKALALSARAAVVDSYIRFPVIGREKHGRTIAVDGGMTLFEPRMVGLGAQAQLVGKNAARRLLDITVSYDRPIDSLLQLRWLTHVPMLAVMPNGVTEISGSLGEAKSANPKACSSESAANSCGPIIAGVLPFARLRNHCNDFSEACQDGALSACPFQASVSAAALLAYRSTEFW